MKMNQITRYIFGVAKNDIPVFSSSVVE